MFGAFCQSALDWDPRPASKRDPFDRRALLVVLARRSWSGSRSSSRLTRWNGSWPPAPHGSCRVRSDRHRSRKSLNLWLPSFDLPSARNRLTHAFGVWRANAQLPIAEHLLRVRLPCETALWLFHDFDRRQKLEGLGHEPASDSVTGRQSD
jgi:hypothetical protein